MHLLPYWLVQRLETSWLEQEHALNSVSCWQVLVRTLYLRKIRCMCSRTKYINACSCVQHFS